MYRSFCIFIVYSDSFLSRKIIFLLQAPCTKPYCSNTVFSLILFQNLSSSFLLGFFLLQIQNGPLLYHAHLMHVGKGECDMLGQSCLSRGICVSECNKTGWVRTWLSDSSSQAAHPTIQHLAFLSGRPSRY